jgi:DNA replication protein DnaC
MLCRDSGYVRVGDRVGRCECQKQKIIRSKLAQIPERYRDVSFLNYVPIDGVQEQALKQVMGDFTKSYFLHGDYARGKTHLATAQYIQLVEIERSCLFLTMAELISELRKAEMDPDYFCTVRERARYAERFHLFVDDIDKFKATDFKFEVLFDLIDTIYKRKCGLTVTSNHTLRELSHSGLLHPSIVRRIDDTCQQVEV